MVSRMEIQTGPGGFGRHAPLLRDVFLPLTAFTAALLLPIGIITATFLVVGQAHFFMTFLYQYKGGKVNRRYIFIALLLALSASVYFLLYGAYIPVFLVSGIAFGLHFAVDEFYLHKQKVEPQTYTTVLGFVLLYGALLFQVLGSAYSFLAVGAGIFIASLIVVRLFLRQSFTRAERYLLFVGLLLFILAFVFHLVTQVLAVVILLHCANWIIGYGEKVHAQAVARSAYWRDTLITLAISCALYGLWVGGLLPVLSFLFLPMYWYVWALAHFVLSSPWVVGAKRPIG